MASLLSEVAKRRALLIAAGVAVALLAPLPAGLVSLASDAGGGLPLDKLVHLALFALLGGSWLSAAAPVTFVRGVVVALAAVAYGALLEWAQSLEIARSAEAADVAADALGVALSALWYRLQRTNAD